MKLTLIVLLAATCLDSFVVMMERGSSMREMKRTKGGCHALIFALVNTVMLFVGMQLSGVIASHHMMEVDRLLSALIFVALATFLLMKVVSRKRYEEHLDLAFSYRKSLEQAVFTGIDTIVLGTALGFVSELVWGCCALMFLLTFLATYIALWVGYYLGGGVSAGNDLPLLSGVLCGDTVDLISVWLRDRRIRYGTPKAEDEGFSGREPGAAHAGKAF